MNSALSPNENVKFQSDKKIGLVGAKQIKPQAAFDAVKGRTGHTQKPKAGDWAQGCTNYKGS